jgi:dienelactone hydrolase
MKTIATALLCLLAIQAPQAPPPSAFTVLPPEREGPRITPFLAYQTEQAWKQDDERRARFAALTTPQDVQRLQGELRRKLLAMIGGLPSEKTPLNARITGRVQGDGFHIEKLVFESLPGVFVTALVYVPEGGAGPHPAVLVACGHSQNGKAYYQALCQRLARRGYVVICWDPVGQGERSQFWDAAAKKSRYNLICGEHAVLGNLAYLADANLARWEVWDGMRALDYLLTRAEVDPARVSITGTSGGGFQAALIGALDPRIHVVAPSCYITSLPMRVHNRIFKDPDSDPEQDLAGFIAAGVDHAGLLLLAYPRPVFVAAAVLDFFPIEGTRTTVREIAAIYRRGGHADRIAMVEGYHEHQFSDDNQRAALEFLDRFNAMPAGRPLPEVHPLDEQALRCTRTGQVMVDEPGARSLLDDISDYYRARRGHEPATIAGAYFDDRYPGVRDWSVRPDDGSATTARAILWQAAGSTTVDDLTIDRIVLHHSGGLVMPVLHVHGPAPGRLGVLLWFSDRGKADAGDWDTLRARVAEGYDVVSFDARGLGETRMRYIATSIDDPSLGTLGYEHAYVSPISGVLADHVYNALLTGRPYYLQLIEDVEIAGRFAAQRLSARTVSVTAEGGMYSVAHDAAAVLPGVRLLPRDDAQPVAWSGLVERREERWPIQYILPGGAYIR